MKIISHRGNLEGSNPNLENTKHYIDSALDKGFDVEVDLWKIERNYYLGHDNPENKVELEWLDERKKNIWLHTKNFNCFESLLDINNDFIYFYYTAEPVVMVSNRVIWSHAPTEMSVYKNCVIPLLEKSQIIENNFFAWYGICTDFPTLLNDKLSVSKRNSFIE